MISIIATGSILVIMVPVTICCLYNTCCRDSKYTCSIYYQPNSDLQDVSVVANRTEAVKDKSSMPTFKLNDSALTGEGPPTYQMAMEILDNTTLK